MPAVPLTRPAPLALDGVPGTLVVGLLAVSVLAATAAPLATYTLTLAAFGMAHVVQELRYLGHRFGGWSGPWLVPTLICLAGICGTDRKSVV